MSFDSNNPEKEKDVIDFSAFKAKKNLSNDLSRGRQPLYISHLDGKLKGSPHLNGPKAEDFGDRLGRIRTSLEKINRLMSELKKISKTEEKPESKAPISILSRH